ncbi:hypothetical protein HpMS107_51530 [Helicobacter pylori]
MGVASGAELDMVTHLFTLAVLSVLAGVFVGGALYSFTTKVWTHVADRLAEKLDAHRAEEVLRLKAECWRLRARAAGKNV